ncbi:cytochrome P450 [Coniophora puteana RWD-64-598 SS2]|uniref:Cytochrome P450 n=1 Tax=Coniophora puteana (strain RWD-64-598) TaxID=741705 RepID=A0A5M3MZH3_CONPW|nr:cytochrome P450 [Coniophora puteana RWD-64-598 SS2]EIW84426.1 cytochrome P450 [Coniophora puteana RWD-64-598 SS2]
MVVNSERIAQELLDKRSRNYSDRIDMSYLIEQYGFGFITTFLHHNNSWRDHRRVLHQTLRTGAISAYWPTLVRRASTLLQSLHTSREPWWEHIEMYAAAIVLGTVYDHELPVKPEDDPTYRAMVEGTDLIFFIGSLGMTALINAIPLVRYTPKWFAGGRWVNAAHCLQSMGTMIDTPYNILQNRIVAGEAGACVMTEALAIFQGTTKLDDAEHVIKDACSTAYAAGKDTTGSTLLVFILAMVLHPHVQKTAQEELDMVVGTGRLPTFNDTPALPYLEAVLRETLRWRPVVPIGVPHTATNEDIYEGYRVPKGTAIIPNVWAISRDPEKYPSPDDFKPERFLDADGKLTNDTCEFVFGFGRRICPGRHFAHAAVWIAMAQILATFTIEKAKDSSGHPVEPAPEWGTGITTYPKPFPCNFVPRQT